jgi:hypothetical protein
MNAPELINLDVIVKQINSHRRNRTLDVADTRRFAELFEANRDNSEVHTIRVYSHQGFVANAYKYRADICFLQAVRNQVNGSWHIGGGVVDAKRSHGNGSLATINSRPA